MNTHMYSNVKKTIPQIKDSSNLYLRPTSVNIYGFANNTLTNQILCRIDIPSIPFLVKVQLVKTIKSTIPTITYTYLHPSVRPIKSIQYYKYLMRNSSTDIVFKDIYSAILKI